MTEGVDYSFARPNPRGLAAAGKCFAVRYVGTPWSDKNLTADEVEQLLAAGVDVVATYESTEGFMLTDDGVRAAHRAFINAADCGMPPGRPVYFCLDVDPARLGPADWAHVERFLYSAATVRGPELVGLYGAYAAVERFVGGWAEWGWQTYGWSHGHWSPKAQLQQYRNGVTLAGGLVDLCRSTTTDFGQWNHRPQEHDMTPEQATKLDEIHAALYADKPGELRQQIWATDVAHLGTGSAAAAAHLRTILRNTGDPVDEDELAAQLLAALTPEAIADAVAARLPTPGDARAFLDQMAARLAT